ncbi:3D domain-containing protein [Turicimonas muris]|nr:3D domain-containing protein [Turicimonas muris]
MVNFFCRRTQSTSGLICKNRCQTREGPLRFDFFWGFGDEAGRNAGKQKSDVSAWILLPKGAAPEDIR